ncbi:hypothetical protein L2D00_07575 [Hyphomonadaceae bacterium BL14]|nr:hypothetical protein L2D00_07575 [Hyphomonadaceae bacterium BL14]
MIAGLLRAAAPIIAIGIAALALGGCFYSDRELIGFWGADTPLQDGVWVHTPTHPDGTEWGGFTWRGELRNQRRRYVSDDVNFPHQNARLRQLHEDTYIAQFPGEAGYGYGIMFVYAGGAMASYHMADCNMLADAAREEAGVALDAEGYCRLTSLDQLEAIMRTYLAARAGDLVIDGVYRREG